eukprot:s3475_g12.t2
MRGLAVASRAARGSQRRLMGLQAGAAECREHFVGCDGEHKAWPDDKWQWDFVLHPGNTGGSAPMLQHPSRF